MTTFDRATALARLAEETFDVVVVGGGITGAGVALDAASRGLRTALVERGDFAAGTSSKSSKLVHGGLRYLNQRDFRLVYEGLAERQRLLDNAPHLVQALPFLIPLYGGKAIAKALNSALWLYDLTGGLRIGKRHKRISVDDTLAHMPMLRRKGLAAGFLYYDARADDARLTLTLVRTAALDHGAVAANYAPVTGILRENGKAAGVRVGDIDVRASAVVNATGVWADEIRALDEGVHPHVIRPAKGIHVTVPFAKVQNDLAVVIPVLKDKRSIFVVPWGDRVYIGTTDTDYQGSLERPTCTKADIAYLLDAANAFLSEPITEGDILGTWAGLRPLVARADSERTADLSRRHQVTRSDSGVVTVTGGKLTTYRRMASDTVDEVADLLGSKAKSRTKKLALRGAVGADSLSERGTGVRLGVDEGQLAHLTSRYGAEARTLAAMVARDPAMGEPLVPSLPYLRAEAVYAARYEMAQNIEDVLSRRTRALLLGRDACDAAADDVAALLAPELGWDDAERQRRVAEFRDLVATERTTAASDDPIDALAGTTP